MIFRFSVGFFWPAEKDPPPYAKSILTFLWVAKKDPHPYAKSIFREQMMYKFILAPQRGPGDLQGQQGEPTKKQAGGTTGTTPCRGRCGPPYKTLLPASSAAWWEVAAGDRPEFWAPQASSKKKFGRRRPRAKDSRKSPVLRGTYGESGFWLRQCLSF